MITYLVVPSIRTNNIATVEIVPHFCSRGFPASNQSCLLQSPELLIFLIKTLLLVFITSSGLTCCGLSGRRSQFFSDSSLNNLKTHCIPHLRFIALCYCWNLNNVILTEADKKSRLGHNLVMVYSWQVSLTIWYVAFRRCQSVWWVCCRPT